MAREKVTAAIVALAAVLNDDSITLPEPGDERLVHITMGMLEEVEEGYDES